jgi:hypothetical protein
MPTASKSLDGSSIPTFTFSIGSQIRPGDAAASVTSAGMSPINALERPQTRNRQTSDE